MISENVLPIFSSAFDGVCFTIKFLIHFEIIFVHGVTMCSSFIDLYAVFPASLAEEAAFFPFYILVSFVED